MKFIITVLITIIFVVGIAFGAYYLGTQNKGAFPFLSTPVPTQTLVGGDKDIHGCIPSAGFTWCEIKQKCLRIWEEPCVSVSPVNYPTVAATVTPTIDESESLKIIIKQLLIAKHGNTANELNITVSKILGNYAQGGASGTGGGGMWFAAKMGGIWKLVWDGNGTILCSDLVAYPDLPNTLISECYDPTTQKIINR